MGEDRVDGNFVSAFPTLENFLSDLKQNIPVKSTARFSLNQVDLKQYSSG